MSAATDCIVLSSSPNREIGTPKLPIGGAKGTSQHDGSLSPVPLPPKTSSPPTRSRFFSAPPYRRTKTTDMAAEEAVQDQPAATDSNAVKTRRERKPKSAPQAEPLELDQAVLEDKENTPAKPKRTRKKREEPAAGGAKLKNKTITGKVSKSGTGKSKASSGKAVDGEQAAREGSAGKKDTRDCEADGLQLEQAMKRRIDWTPTKARPSTVVDLEDKEDAEPGQAGLGQLLSGYEFDGTTATGDRAQVLANDGPTKRRRIELVDPRVMPVKPLPLVEDSHESLEGEPEVPAAPKPNKKPKARAKRLTTLTARVTAPYSRASADSSDFTSQEISGAAVSSTVATSKSRKTKKKTNQSSEFKMPRTVVISPGEAVQSLDQQDLVFGTCSQLERADSPTLLKDTQAALQESEKDSACAFSRLNQYPGISQQSSAISRLTTRRNLWSAAARVTEGSAIDIETVNLVDSPEAPKTTTQSLDDRKEANHERSDSSEAVGILTVSTATTLSTGDSPIDKGLPASTNSTVEQTTSKSETTFKPPMPYYKGKTDLQLAKDFQTYGFKPIKNRQKMIETLEKCWIAKHGPTPQDEGQDLQSQQIKATSSTSEPQNANEERKKPKAMSQRKAKLPSQSQTDSLKLTKENRERITTTTTKEIKQTTKSKAQHDSQPPLKRYYADVEEIQDSEDDEIPSPSSVLNLFLGSPLRDGEKSKRRKSELSTSPAPTSPTTPSRRKQTKALPTSTGSPSKKLPDLGEQVTKAVRAQPQQVRTHSPAGTRKRPTWHEKILMYDPIFLEDFTVWLNTEGLGLVGEDREVGAGFVRQWCESKGICCCYRVKKPGHH